jgi:hypothetical protein
MLSRWNSAANDNVTFDVHDFMDETSLTGGNDLRNRIGFSRLLPEVQEYSGIGRAAPR